MTYKYTDTRKKTIRTNTKSTYGGLLSGVEAHHQGLEIINSNQDRSALPILGRSGAKSSGYQYDEVQSVFKRVMTPKSLEENSTIELSFDIAASVSNLSANLSNGDPHFLNLIGQTFNIVHPITGTTYTFIFTADVGFDVRDVFFCHVNNPLSTGYIHATSGNYGNYYTLLDSLRIPNRSNIWHHSLSPLVPHPDGMGIQNQTTFDKMRAIDGYTSANPNPFFGVQDPNTGNYQIPIGIDVSAPVFSTNSPDGKSRRGRVTESRYSDPVTGFQRIMDYSDPVHAASVVQGWYIEFCVAAAMNIVFKDIEDVIVDTTSLNYNSPSEYDSVNNAKLKLKFLGTRLSNTVNSGDSNIVVDSWGTDTLETVYVGERKIVKDPRRFHEDELSDTLRASSGHSIFQSTNSSVYNISLRDNIIPEFNGAPRETVEEYVDAQNLTEGETVAVPLFKMGVSQRRETLFNTYEDDFLYHEDVHYNDPNEQTWSKLQNTWRIYTQGANDTEGFMNYITDMLDGRYTRAELIPETPMSGIVNVFETSQGFYENMPHHVLENSRGSVLTQWLDNTQSPETIKNEWYRHPSQIGVKKFEDLIGQRTEERVIFNDYFDQPEALNTMYIEDERWSRIDNDILQYLTTYIERDDKIDRREWQEDDYLYGGTGSVSSTQSSRSSIINRDQKR